MTTRITRPAGLAALGATLALAACAVSPGQLGQLGNLAGQLPGASPAPGGGASPAASTGTPAPGGSAAPAAPGAEKEPNDDFPQATAIAIGSVISAEAKEGDAQGDYFQIAVPAGAQAGWLTAALSKASDDWTPMITFYQANKEWLHEKGANGGTQDQLVVAIPAKAGNAYYVKVSPSAGATSGYKLKLEFDPVKDMNEPNDDFPQAKPLTLGKAVAFATFHAADAPDDLDYFTFDVPAGKAKLKIDLANKSTSDDPANYTVAIYDAAKAFVNEVSGGSQADITGAEIEVPVAGTYYAKVTGPRNEALSELTITAE